VDLDVVLIYPFIGIETKKKSMFRFPPLGLGYLASTLKDCGISVTIVDGTFSTLEETVEIVRNMNPRVIGINSMVTINHNAIEIANLLRNDTELLVAGGPLPSLIPDTILNSFDVIVLGEGEYTFLEIVRNQIVIS